MTGRDSEVVIVGYPRESVGDVLEKERLV